MYITTRDAGVWGYDQRTVQVLQRMQRESLGQATISDHQDTAEKVCQRALVLHCPWLMVHVGERTCTYSPTLHIRHAWFHLFKLRCLQTQPAELLRACVEHCVIVDQPEIKKMITLRFVGLRCFVLCCDVMCCVLCCVVLYCVVSRCVVLCCIVLFCGVLCCFVLCCAVLCCVVLYGVALCCFVLLSLNCHSLDWYKGLHTRHVVYLFWDQSFFSLNLT